MARTVPSNLRAIALEAGVSVDTVSRVLNGRIKGMRKDALERASRIQQIASELNYRPNSNARSMRSSRTRQVGVLLRNRPGPHRHTHPLAFETILGINEGLQAEGYVVSIIRVTDVEDAARTRVFKEHVLDGMIIVDAMPDAVHDEVQRHVRNCVWADSNVWRDTGCIRRDERHAGRLAAEALRDLGYRRWIWAGLPDSPDRNYSLTERRAGVMDVAQACGAEVRTHYIASAKASELDSNIVGDLAVDVGVVAYGVYQARSIAHLSTSLGLSPAYHYGLVCCDDSADIRRMWPGLSRVEFDRFSMGRRAASMLLEMLEGDVQSCESQHFRDRFHPGNTAWGPHRFAR
jgi:LacI family transcriptional regulator